MQCTRSTAFNLLINRQRKPSTWTYETYVTFTSTLSWNAHIDTIAKKANNTTAFLRRNLSTCPSEVKDTCYKTFVKPHVEYAATVKDPHLTENAMKVEAVQRRAARFLTGDYRTTSCITAMVDSLSWEPPANQGHYDVSYITCHCSHTNCTTPPALWCCHKRSSVQIKGTILPDQHIQELLLPVNHQTVGPAARRTGCCRIPGCLQSRDISQHKALDSKMILSYFSFLTRVGHSPCVYSINHQCGNAGATGLAL